MVVFWQVGRVDHIRDGFRWVWRQNASRWLAETLVDRFMQTSGGRVVRLVLDQSQSADVVEVKRYKTVDDYIDRTKHWQDELRQLREILNSTHLEETVKWGGPCYTFDSKNVVRMVAFTSYFGLWFFQGALLADLKQVLITAQDGKTKALRQWRFQSKKEINGRVIKMYVNEAISLQKEGLEIKPARGQAVNTLPQLRAALSENKRADAAFKTLPQGKQREYADYIAAAKREETKVNRLARIIPMIVAGKGLNDKYRNC